MALADVLAATTVTGFSAADEATIRDAISTAYNGSATAAGLFDNWVATPANAINVQFLAGAFQAFTNTGTIQIDLNQLTNASYIDNNGTAVEDTAVTGIVHELVHAIVGLTDNWDRSLVGDYRGDTVILSNTIYAELGLPEQNSYIAYDSSGNVLTRDFQYTNGAAIDRSITGDRDMSTAPAGNSNDLLVGGPSGNALQTGGGNDFIFGGGGDDAMNGGAGLDTVVLTGEPIDYDLRLNADGATWTSRHVRGDADEGTDTFTNLEQVRFEGGETFNLSRGGLTYQSDFAFVVDTTGSMFDDIAAVQASANAVIDTLFDSGSIDARIGVVTFKDDTIGQPTQVVLPFTDQDDFAARQTAAAAAINSLSASGGGDFPETAFSGLLAALDGSMGDWRDGAGTKRIALFTDASAKDVSLAPTVAALAANLGVSVSGRASQDLGETARVDTFSFEPDLSASQAARFDEDDGFVYLPDDAPATPVGGIPNVQITTIFIDTFIDGDDALAEVSEGSGGSVLTAADPAGVVETLLEVIETANYTVTTDLSAAVEGDAALSTVTFTVSRDRADETSTVTLGTFGDADSDDVTGVPTTLDFAIGETEKQIVVSVVDDEIVEEIEVFGLEITGVSESATVSIPSSSFTITSDDVAPETGAPPVAGNDLFMTDFETPITISVADLLVNDDDGDPTLDQTLTITSVTSGTGGVATLAGSSVNFVADAGFSGPASFTYELSDGVDGTDTGTVQIDVATPPPPPPTDDGPFIPSAYDNQFFGTASDNPLQGTSTDDWIDGMDGKDNIFADDGDDYIIAGPGNDGFVRGGAGADIFQFGIGDERVKIFDWEDGVDRIRLVDGLTPEDFDIRVSSFNGIDTTIFTTATGDRLEIRSVTPDQITDEDFIIGSVTEDPFSSDSYDTLISHGDGDSRLFGTDLDDFILGGGGRDNIFADDGDDYIDPGSGNDGFVRGGSGEDIFVFGLGSDSMKLFDFEDGVDIIALDNGLTFADLTASTSTFNGVVTASFTSSEGDRLQIRDADLTTITAEDFVTI